jgi:hypothetical protein
MDLSDSSREGTDAMCRRRRERHRHSEVSPGASILTTPKSQTQRERQAPAASGWEPHARRSPSSDLR